jgi:hypothetical protein
MILCFTFGAHGAGGSMGKKQTIKATGAFHHMIIRGIGSGKVLCEKADRIEFLNRLWVGCPNAR